MALSLPSLLLLPATPFELSLAISLDPSLPLIIRGSENEALPAPLLCSSAISNPETTRLYLSLFTTPSCPSADPSILIIRPPNKYLPLLPLTGCMISKIATGFLLRKYLPSLSPSLLPPK